ncbi:MAG: Hsp33 family molecular chaperone HslO [Clostridia bacterium]|nr:Hsp33 family molecular chaperone HslO [Clostridia bacterium]
MKNTLRTLVFNGQVSLTIANTTGMVNDAIRYHMLSASSAKILGKALSAMTFMSACLKNSKGEISLSVQNGGECGDIAVSGNKELHMRGYIGNPFAEGDEENCFAENSALTIIRDDGYNRPFVGSCAWQTGGVDDSFEEYFHISEQLPTRIRTVVEIGENGQCNFAGVIALQLLPFADEEALAMTANTPLEEILQKLKTTPVERLVGDNFDADISVWEGGLALYQCNCSREYLKKVLVTIGKADFNKIVEEDGAVKVHCHYCNSDYTFTKEDEEEIFGK